MKLRRLLVSGIAGITLVAGTFFGIGAPPAQASCAPTCTAVVNDIIGVGWVPPWLLAIVKPVIDPIINPLLAFIPINEIIALMPPPVQTTYAQTTMALSFTFPTTTKPLAVDGSATSFVLTPGKWRIQVAGTYIYDNAHGPNILADAECSLPSPLWRDTIDASDDALAGGGAPPGLLHDGWHSDRYGLGYPTADGPGALGYPASPGDHATRAYVNGLPVDWSPTVLPPLKDNVGSVNDPKCNTVDHTYYEDVLVAGTTPYSVSIFDIYYNDNAPLGSGMTVTVTKQM